MYFDVKEALEMKKGQEAKAVWRRSATEPSKLPIKVAPVDPSSEEPSQQPFTFTIGIKKVRPSATPSCPPRSSKLSQSSDVDSIATSFKSPQKKEPTTRKVKLATPTPVGESSSYHTFFKVQV